jgi:protein-S-isoprenylcysteine O-methyltransferase Ste14
MKYLKTILYVIGFLVLLILLAGQILSIASTTNTMEIIGRTGLILVVGMFFAIRWQRNKKKKSENDLSQ